MSTLSARGLTGLDRDGEEPGAARCAFTFAADRTTRNFTKVRIDPATLLVDISDQTFSSSTGSLIHGGETVSSMPFGVGMSCDDTASGVGNIDLGGTPFAVATDEFLVGGFDSSGSATYSPDSRVVTLAGGGYCGWICASPATFNPFNDAGDFRLQLVFAP